MTQLRWLALMLLAGCTPNVPVPKVDIPEVCEQQVYADPVVKAEIMKGAGSDYYRSTHEDDLAYAKYDATNRCLFQKGLGPKGGGVERIRRPGS